MRITVLQKISKTTTEIGVFPACVHALNRILEGLGARSKFYLYHLFAQPVRPGPAMPANLGRTLEVREILEGSSALDNMPVPAEVIERRFRQSAVCMGTFKGEELVAYMWYCAGPYEEDEVRCTFIPMPLQEAVWDFDVYVFPKHRLGAAFARLWGEVNRHLGAKGISISMSRVSAFNPASFRSHKGLAARKVGAALFLCSGKFQLTVSTTSPYFHLSASDSSQPTIRVADRRSSTAD